MNEIVYSEKYSDQRIITEIDIDKNFQNLPNFHRIEYLNLSCNYLFNINELPEDLIELDCSHNNLRLLPKLPKKLKKLNCHHCDLIELPELPENLIILNCFENKLVNLPKLPETLNELFCHDNYLEKLPKLPENLIMLCCSYNKLKEIPKIPNSCKDINIGGNKIEKLTNLPNNFSIFICNNNEINNLPIINKNINASKIFMNNNPVYDYIKLYFNGSIKNYIIWNYNVNLLFANKIGNWFLDCKYNPKYKYCRKILIDQYNQLKYESKYLLFK